MQWAVSLEVSDSAAGRSQHARRNFTVESKSVAMALEKAVSEARRIGLRTLSVASCNPIIDFSRAR